jgi:regulator of RNase E activity RraA
VIEPGDLVLGDRDGVLCVPFGEVDAIFRAAKAKQESEVRQAVAIEAGTSDRTWVDETLKRLGCEFADSH